MLLSEKSRKYEDDKYYIIDYPYDRVYDIKKGSSLNKSGSMGRVGVSFDTKKEGLFAIALLEHSRNCKGYFYSVSSRSDKYKLERDPEWKKFEMNSVKQLVEDFKNDI